MFGMPLWERAPCGYTLNDSVEGVQGLLPLKPPFYLDLLFPQTDSVTGSTLANIDLVHPTHFANEKARDERAGVICSV